MVLRLPYLTYYFHRYVDKKALLVNREGSIGIVSGNVIRSGATRNPQGSANSHNNSGEDPTLSIFNRLPSTTKVTIHNQSGTSPSMRGDAIFVITIPPSFQDTIVIQGINLIVNA